MWRGDADLISGLQQLNAKKTPIEKYMYLSNLRNNNVHLFYRLVQEHLTVCFYFDLLGVIKWESKG